MSLRKYDSYKDSGVAEVGLVPSHWSAARLRFTADLNPSKSEIAHLNRNTDVSFLPMEAIGENGSLDLGQTRTIGEVEAGYSYFREGDVAVAKITPCFENGKGAILRHLVGGIGFGTTELIVCRPIASQTTAEFLQWLFTSSVFRQMGEGSMYGAGGQKRVSDDFVRNFLGFFPPLAEQSAIVTFLDWETAKIDALAEEQKRLIELLKEKRQAVISHAVTNGLDPKAQKRDSGVEWLGEVPAHWKISRIKHLATNVVDCLHSTPTYDGDLIYPAIRTADIERGNLLMDQARLVSEETYRERVQRLPPIENDILYSREGERFGMAALVPAGTTLCLGQRMMMVRISHLDDAAFIMWVLNSEAVYQQVIAGTTGSTSPHVNIVDVVNFHVPLPPIAEQRAIARSVFAKVDKIDRLIAEAESAGIILSERRSALISAAVTGKIDVRGMVSVQAAAA